MLAYFSTRPALGWEADDPPKPARAPMSETGREPTLPDDAELLRRVAARDRSACAELYDRFAGPLYSVALRVLSDPAEAEDIVQEVFVVLWSRAAEFDASRGSAFAWAVTFTRNRAIDRVRSRRRRADLLAGAAPDVAPVDLADATDSADNLIFRERAQAVRRALTTLPTEQVKALELAFFKGKTQLEIAAELNEPLGTVKARIRRGLLKLRDLLEGQR